MATGFSQSASTSSWLYIDKIACCAPGRACKRGGGGTLKGESTFSFSTSFALRHLAAKCSSLPQTRHRVMLPCRSLGFCRRPCPLPDVWARWPLPLHFKVGKRVIGRQEESFATSFTLAPPLPEVLHHSAKASHWLSCAPSPCAFRLSIHPNDVLSCTGVIHVSHVWVG